MVLRQTLMRLSEQAFLRDFATTNSIAQGFAHRFVAGETADEAIAVVRNLNAAGMTATLDHLGENVRTQAEAVEAAESYCALLRNIADAGVDCNVSLKLTQFGLELGDDLAQSNVCKVLDQAAQRGTFVRIDMESFDTISRTLGIFYRVFEQYNHVGVVIQSYLYRSEADIRDLNARQARVRLVKGAYLEPATVAYPAKPDVDRNYVRLAEMLLRDGNYPAIATHDENMIDAVKAFAREHGIDPARYEFQMLYGIRRDLQTQLVQQGYNVRIYVPFGTAWYAYMMRRMAERPANLLFVLNSVAREGRSAPAD